jgi:hypothetical protein
MSHYITFESSNRVISVTLSFWMPVQMKKYGEENRQFESWRGQIGPLARIYTPETPST